MAALPSMLRTSKLPRLAVIPAALLLFATIAWHLQQARIRRAEPQSPPAANTATSAPSATPPDLNIIAQWEPYGAATAAGATAPAAPVVASTLNIQLRGTVASAAGGKGSAIIADEAGGEKAYRIGDSIGSQATLAEVKPREIVIKHAEQMESIALPRNPSEGGGEAAALPEATNIPQAAIPTPPPPSPTTPVPKTASASPAVSPGAPTMAPAAAPATTAAPAPAATPPQALPPGEN